MRQPIPHVTAGADCFKTGLVSHAVYPLRCHELPVQIAQKGGGGVKRKRRRRRGAIAKTNVSSSELSDLYEEKQVLLTICHAGQAPACTLQIESA